MLPFIGILASKINFSFDVNVIVQGVIMLHHSKWEAKVDSELKACHEERFSALVGDKYAMVLKNKDVTVGHVPKFLSN